MKHVLLSLIFSIPLIAFAVTPNMDDPIMEIVYDAETSEMPAHNPSNQ